MKPRTRPLTGAPPAGTRPDWDEVGGDCGLAADGFGGVVPGVLELPPAAPLRAAEDAVRAAAAGFSTIRIGSRSAGSGVNVDGGKVTSGPLDIPVAAREPVASGLPLGGGVLAPAPRLVAAWPG